MEEEKDQRDGEWVGVDIERAIEDFRGHVFAGELDGIDPG